MTEHTRYRPWTTAWGSQAFICRDCSTRATAILVPADERDEHDRDFHPCEWFAACDQPAAGTVRHPALGLVPTCSRCVERMELTFEATS